MNTLAYDKKGKSTVKSKMRILEMIITVFNNMKNENPNKERGLALIHGRDYFSGGNISVPVVKFG